MNEKELSCNRCYHKDVCKHLKDYADICAAVESLSIHQYENDGKVKMTPVENFECLGDINVTCKFFKEVFHGR